MNKRKVLVGMASSMALLASTALAAQTQIGGPGSLGNNPYTGSGSNAGNRAEMRSQIKQEMAGLKDQRAQLKTDRQQLKTDRCQNIQERVNRFGANRQNFENVYTNMQARLARLVTLFKSKGIDTTKLESDIATLKTKIDTLLADQDAVKQAVGNVSTDQCTKDQTANKDAFAEARQLELKVKQDRVAIRTFFQETIKPDLLAIRKQLETLKEDSAPTTTSDTNSGVLVE